MEAFVKDFSWRRAIRETLSGGLDSCKTISVVAVLFFPFWTPFIVGWVAFEYSGYHQHAALIGAAWCVIAIILEMAVIAIRWNGYSEEYWEEIRRAHPDSYGTRWNDM